MKVLGLIVILIERKGSSLESVDSASFVKIAKA